MNASCSRTPGPYLRRQRGAVLIFALIALVAMTMAGFSLLRSSDISTQIAGNLSFRQSGTQASDAGVEMGRKWLMSAGTLDNDVSPVYFATWNGGVVSGDFDPTTFDWAGHSNSLSADAAGNAMNYVIHRMCQNPGDPTSVGANCITAPGSSEGDTRDASGSSLICPPGSPACIVATTPYYRITVRVAGPRNTMTYVQSVIY